MLSLVTLGPISRIMKHDTPMALETAPPQEPHPSERKPHGPADARSNPPQPPSRGGWVWWLVLLILAGVGYWQWPKLKTFLPSGETAGQGTAKGRGRRGAGGGVSQVVATRATRGSIKVFVTGLGAVTPIYTVTLKSRVDRATDESRVQRRADGSSGRPADGDRSAAL